MTFVCISGGKRERLNSNTLPAANLSTIEYKVDALAMHVPVVLIATWLTSDWQIHTTVLTHILPCIYHALLYICG